MDVQEHLAAGEAHGDLALPSGVVSGPLTVTGVGEVLCAGNCGEQSQGDRGPGDGVELLAQLGDALTGGAQGGDEALVLGGQADGLGAGLAQLVTGEVLGGHAQRLHRVGAG